MRRHSFDAARTARSTRTGHSTAALGYDRTPERTRSRVLRLVARASHGSGSAGSRVLDALPAGRRRARRRAGDRPRRPGLRQDARHRRARRPPDRRRARAARAAARPHLLAQGGGRPARADRRRGCSAATRASRSRPSTPSASRSSPRDATEPPRLARPAERRERSRAALAAEGNLGLRPTNALVDEALALRRALRRLPRRARAPARARPRALRRALAERGALDYGGLQREAVALLEQTTRRRRATATPSATSSSTSTRTRTSPRSACSS